jgi:hypothetical protein
MKTGSGERRNMMGFVKSLEEIAASFQQNAIFYDAERLTVYVETIPDKEENAPG